MPPKRKRLRSLTKESSSGSSSKRMGSSSTESNERKAKRSATPTPPTNQEYASALAVMSEATLSQACSLLLSENGYNESNEKQLSDRDQLLALYSKCHNAYQLIQRMPETKLSPASTQSSFPPAPQVMPPPRGHPSRVQSKPLKTQSLAKTMMPPRRGMSMQRGASVKKIVPPASKQIVHGKLQRQESDSSSVSSSTSSARGSSMKKPRLSPPLAKFDSAPPPEALSFLAALNSQKEQGDTSSGVNESSPSFQTARAPSRRKTPARFARK